MELLAATVLSATSLNFTCAPGSVEESLPFCNTTLSFDQRSADLASRLTLDELLNYWGSSYPSTKPVERYNVKSWSLDHSCTHGVNKANNVSVFPHSLAQAASFDPDLVSRIGNATMTEMRILSWKEYFKSNGANQGSYLSCDGGPMANTAHDPRWGRNSETYGEDPYVISTIGTAAMNALQDRRPFSGGSTDDEYYATRQTNTIYLGYHSARPDLEPADMFVTNRSLADSYLRGYEALQRPDKGHADGIMCAMSSVNGVPPCGSEYFMKTILRDQWNSDAMIQTDCCDSIRTMNSEFHFENITTDYEALKIAIDRGNVQVYYGYSGSEFIQDWKYHIGNGTLSQSQLQDSVARIIKSQMRIGLFDTWSPSYPYKNSSFDWSLLDSSTHRQLAREAAGKTVVLLQNKGDFLPLQRDQKMKVFVTGPFADCQECYVHSYAGNPSYVTTLRDGLENSVGPSTSLSYSLGSNATCPAGVDNCWTVAGSVEQKAFQSAVAASKGSDVIIVTLGLGVNVEREGLDRTTVGLPPIQDALLSEIVNTNPNTKIVLVFVSGSGADFNTTGVTSVIYAPYGGEEGGSGIADVLFGDVVPSARLPVTFYNTKWMQEATSNNLTMPHFDLDLTPKRTYRYVTPDHVKYGFGYGLSYTRFEYSQLFPSYSKQSKTVTVKVTVANVGARDGAEVTQVYFTPPPGLKYTVASINLIYFTKTMIKAGSNTQLTAEIPLEEFAIAQEDGSRQIVPGMYGIHVGGHLPGEIGTSGPVITKTLIIN